MTKRQRITCAFCVLMLTGVLAGCGMPKDEGTTVERIDTAKPDPAAIKKQIAEIQANPNIPQQQKDMILGRLYGQLGSSSEGGKSETEMRREQAAKGAKKP